MTNYQMDLGYSGGTMTFDITPKFFPRMRFNWKRSGHEVSVIDTIPVHGWFSENVQATLLAKWNLLRQIAHNGSPTRVIFRMTTGTVIYQFNHAHIMDLESVDQGGGFVNHVEFTFNVEEERGITYSGLVDVGRNDEENKDHDKYGNVKITRRREVMAIGENAQLSSAHSFVIGQKPIAGKMIHESIKEDPYSGEVRGVWDYDVTGDLSFTGIKSWKEEATIKPGQRSAKFYRTPGGPILLRGGLGESSLDVSGHIEAYEEGSLPGSAEIVGYFYGEAHGAVTDVILNGPPSLSASYPVEYDLDNPSVPSVWGLNYSFSLAYGEAGPDAGLLVRPTVRHIGTAPRPKLD